MIVFFWKNVEARVTEESSLCASALLQKKMSIILLKRKGGAQIFSEEAGMSGFLREESFIILNYFLKQVICVWDITTQMISSEE